jgi:hypothetical protein
MVSNHALSAGMVNFEPDARAGSGDDAPIRQRSVNFWQKPRFGLLARPCPTIRDFVDRP